MGDGIDWVGGLGNLKFVSVYDLERRKIVCLALVRKNL